MDVDCVNKFEAGRARVDGCHEKYSKDGESSRYDELCCVGFSNLTIVFSA